jgi:hypothetical protein
MLTEVELYYGSLRSNQIRSENLILLLNFLHFAEYLIRDGISEAVKAIVERCKTLTSLAVISSAPLIPLSFPTSVAELQMWVVIEYIEVRLGVSATQALNLVPGMFSLVWRAKNGTTLTWEE